MKITLKHLTKIFPNREKGKPDVVAVNDFDFSIPDGKLVSLLGPSGCGKSTALNLICGLEKPTKGQIFFDETDVTERSPRDRGVGMVFQSYALYPHLTVRKNIIYPLKNFKGDKKLTKEEMNRRAEEAAKLVQISELMERRPSELSGGQQQRVAIARALVKMPEVLLLDEPLSNLDARLRLQTREEIRRIQQETGITTIFVTHDQEEAMSISDIMVVMKSGTLHQMGEPQEIYDSPANLFVAKFLGTPPINVFEGRLEKGTVYIGNDAVLKIRKPGGGDFSDMPVYVGIRPEGFMPDAEGPFVAGLKALEVMGRDTSVVFTHDDTVSEVTRAIISSKKGLNTGDGVVRFSVLPEKLHIFDKETETRIPFEV